jgi:single-strand DNA-binding protein
MARSLNLVIIEGNMGKDPEMRYTPSGKPVTEFSLATSRPYKDTDDAWQEETTWWRVIVWGDAAERVAQSGASGAFCRVTGRLHATEWAVDGCPKGVHRGFELIASTVDVMGRFERRDNDGGQSRRDTYVDSLPGRGSQVPNEPVAAGAPTTSGTQSVDLDDLPF